jgi:hypothetical protein
MRIKGAETVSVFIIVALIFIVLAALSSCSKYQVVSEVNVNLYHMHNPKNNQVEIILTKEKLEVGKWYNLKSIKKVDPSDDIRIKKVKK